MTKPKTLHIILVLLLGLLHQAFAESKVTSLPQEYDQKHYINLQSQEKDSTNQKSTFQKFGDIAQFLPAASLGYALILRDFIGARDQVIGFIAVIASTYAIKYSFKFFADTNPQIAQLAKRPVHNAYEGFPSGHTSSAFSAVGFLQKRYGVRLGLPAAIVATAVGISRIHSQRHTVLQVICGGMLGFFVSFFLTRARKKNTASKPINNKTLICELGLISLMFL